jgi:hypothetical protein
MALLVIILGTWVKTAHSEFLNLYPKVTIQISTKKVFVKKEIFKTNLVHILLPICGKFTRAQIAHQIFFAKQGC